MKSAQTLLLLAALALGCDSTTEPLASNREGAVLVLLQVTGDPTTDTTLFNVYLDGNIVGAVHVNDSLELTVVTGSHTVRIGSREETAAWCQIFSPPQAVRVASNQVLIVAFNVTCPPLVGTGILTLNVFATAPDLFPPAPDSFQVTLTRINGPNYSQTVSVPANSSMKVTLPVGVYLITESSGCFDFAVVFGQSPPYVVMRSGTPASHTIDLLCVP